MSGVFVTRRGDGALVALDNIARVEDPFGQAHAYDREGNSLGMLDACPLADLIVQIVPYSGPPMEMLCPCGNGDIFAVPVVALAMTATAGIYLLGPSLDLGETLNFDTRRIVGDERIFFGDKTYANWLAYLKANHPEIAERLAARINPLIEEPFRDPDRKRA